MKLKNKLSLIIQLVFIGFILLANISVYQKYNYFNEADNISYIPDDCQLAGTIKTNELAGKFLYYFIYDPEPVLKVIEDHAGEKFRKNNPIQAGLDVNDQVSFYVRMDVQTGHNYIGLVADVFSVNDLEAWLVKNKRKKLNAVGEMGVYSIDSTTFITFNDEVSIALKFQHKPTEGELKNIVTKAYEKKGKLVKDELLSKLKLKSDFAVFMQPPAELSGKGIKHISFSGEMDGDHIDMDFDLIFNHNVEHLFDRHATPKNFDFESLDGYFYSESNFNIANAENVLYNLPFLKISDSLSEVLHPVLDKQQCNRLQVYVNSFTKAELNVPEDADLTLKYLASDFFLPAFNLRLYCSNANSIDMVLNRLVAQGKLKMHDGKYMYERDKHYKIYLSTDPEYLRISTDQKNTGIVEPGYSNLVYFNLTNLMDKIPNMEMKYFLGDYDFFHSAYIYSDKGKDNTIHAVGRINFPEGSNGMVKMIDNIEKFRLILTMDLSQLLKGVL